MSTRTAEVSKINKPSQKRDLVIDRFRGSLVVLMVIGDYISGIQWVPSFLKHAPDIGLTIADLVAPAFVFVIGLNYGKSFNRRLAHGEFEAYRHFGTRYSALIGIGAIISAGALVVGDTVAWGVLQSLGVAGLICLAFIRIPTWDRFILGLLILFGYQYLLDTFLLDSVLNSSHGGFFGSISWAALLLLSTAVADVWEKGFVPYISIVALLGAVATVSAFVVPISKNRVSASYILLTLAISAMVFVIFKALGTKSSEKAGLFSYWGQSAISLYLLHLIVLSAFVLPPFDWWYAQAPILLTIIQLLVILGVMSLVAFWLWRWRETRTNNAK